MEPQTQSRLLIVDDEPSVLKLIKTVLTRARFEVVSAGSGTEALRLLDEQDFDCVITDAVMPMMSGYDLVMAIRRHPGRAHLPVLMLTRKRHRTDVKKAVEAGVSDYVLKPIDEHLLLDKVELCLRKGLGKRHIVELSLSGQQASGTLTLPASVASISETGISMRVPLLLGPDHVVNFSFPIFQEIGIEVPFMKFVTADPVTADVGNDRKDMDWEVRYAFVGVQEADLMKIRSWIQRELIRRKK